MNRNVKIIDASSAFLSKIFNEKESPRRDYAKKTLMELENVNVKYVSRTFYKELLRNNRIPEVDRIYREVEMNLPSRSIVVVDSIEVITQQCKISESSFAYMFQKDLVEPADAILIFVSEKNVPSSEDYVLDGVIKFENIIDGENHYRILEILKLRGTGIERPSYTFTLTNGRFRTIDWKSNENLKTGKFQPLIHPDGFYSSGIKDLDAVLGKGFREGSVVNIEVGKDVPLELIRIIRCPILINGIFQDNGVIHVSAPGASYNTIKNLYLNFMSEEIFDENYIQIDYVGSKSFNRNHIALGAMDNQDAYKAAREALESLLRKKFKAIIWVNFDALEYFYGPELSLKRMIETFSAIRNSKALYIGLTKPGERIATEISNIVDYRFKLLTMNNAIFIQGIKPNTVLYGIEIDEEKGFPNINLIPVQ